jgi:hypothetical protein
MATGVATLNNVLDAMLVWIWSVLTGFGLALGPSIMSLVGVVMARLDADSEVEMGDVAAVDAVR